VQRIQGPEQEPEETAQEVASNRLQGLLSSFSILQQDGRALIDQIRLSLHRMRSLRDQLQKHHNSGVKDSGDGSEGGRLKHFQIQYGLTPRETEVAALLMQGRSNTAIAAALQISTHTARHHTQRVLTKLGVHSRAEAGAKLRA
jgi:DNA-binding NarL/FixJ family response regulator